MKEFKGTPGPWFIGNFGGVGGSGSFIGANPQRDGCTYIAELKGVSGTVDSNAKLIAAAPELLEMLQDILADYEDILLDEYSTEPEDNKFCIKARAVISKALGE